jgi:nucleoside-diphosphate-sugar epimerase
MLVAIAGGHGKIARWLTRLLVANGEQVRGLIRKADHADDLREDRRRAGRLRRRACARGRDRAGDRRRGRRRVRRRSETG